MLSATVGHESSALVFHRVALVCDFFYPSTGGVENHILSLAQCLLRQGHKVIVITHRYGSRVGVRWLAGGLKVYYVPFASVYDRCVMPTGGLMLPLLRDILVREKITVVHTHAVCTMAFEAVVLGALMGYRVAHTEHSNFGFSSPVDIHLNKLEQFVLRNADTVISVSHTSKENVCLRCKLDPSEVFVIPNAVDASQFKPDPDNIRPKGTVNVIIMTRLVWRKGIHLLVDLVPEVCRRFPYVYFIIGGDGPKRAELEEMRERHHLQDRVELLGAVQHSDVPSVLTRGHIFLNTSLTEAFCIAILEAVSCGLVVISTRVGGVPEILPRHMIHLTEPEPGALLEALSQVVPFARKKPATSFHGDVTRMYSWMSVARRTVKVYDALLPRPRLTLLERFQKLSTLGPIAGPVAIVLVAWQYLLLCLLRLWRPACSIEAVPDFPTRAARLKYESLPVSSRWLSRLREEAALQGCR
jgi:phosphatidylinositol glycan class A protein